MELLQILLMAFLWSCLWLWKQQAWCDHLEDPVLLSGKKSVSVTSTGRTWQSLDLQPVCRFVIWILFRSYESQIFFPAYLLYYGLVYGVFVNPVKSSNSKNEEKLLLVSKDKRAGTYNWKEVRLVMDFCSTMLKARRQWLMAFIGHWEEMPDIQGLHTQPRQYKSIMAKERFLDHYSPSNSCTLLEESKEVL